MNGNPMSRSEPSAGIVANQSPNRTLGSVDMSVGGRTRRVRAAIVDGQAVIVVGKWIRMAQVADEMFLPGDIVGDPAVFVRTLKGLKLKADVFSFLDKTPGAKRAFDYYLEWENLAAIDTTDFNTWWEALPQETRKNVRRAAKRGVTVRAVSLDDELVRGIVEIYHETPVRQGKPFAHYDKDFETIKREVSTFPANSEFIGAFHGSELVGFIKVIHLGNVASILHIVSKNSHYDRRPTNALIAETVALCARKGVTHLIYGNYTYGQKVNDTLSEFKRRNGFDKIMIPRYYVPLTRRGALILALKLHKGLIDILPGRLILPLLQMRSWALRTMTRFRPKPEQPSQQEAV
jgi:hypothetical protein